MKRVLINGGSRGIGAACVRRFAEAGDAVAFTYLRSASAAERLAEETGALAIRADAASGSDVERAVLTMKEALGEPDILINNAAYSSFSLFTELTDEEWRKTMSVNLDGAFRFARAVLPGMIRNRWGRIVNISSVWGKSGASCEVHYSASKAALNGLTLALAKEVGPSAITVNAVLPGVIDTDMNRHLTEEDMAALAEETPLCRIGRPEEVAAAVFFLASEEASFITGECLAVSGGFSL